MNNNLNISNILAVTALSNIVESSPESFTALPEAVSTWKTGQTLKAVVMEQTKPGIVTVSVGKDLIPLHTTAKVNIGEVLQLTVKHTGKLVQLELTPPPKPDPSKAIINDALLTALPKQASLAPLFKSLTQIIHHENQLPTKLVQLVKNILTSLPSSSTITKPEIIAESINNSGSLLEHKLLQASTPANIEHDLKANLLRLISELPTAQKSALLNKVMVAAAPETALPIPPKDIPLPERRIQDLPNANLPSKEQVITNLSTQAQASLARIELHQLASIPKDKSLDDFVSSKIKESSAVLTPPQSDHLSNTKNDHLSITNTSHSPTVTNLWCEIPVRVENRIDIFQFKIEEEESSAKHANTSHQWSVMMAVDLPELGPLQVKVSLRQGQINSHIWAQEITTVKLFETNILALKRSLELAGLKVESIETHHGMMPQAKSQSTDGPNLLDVNI